MFFTYFYQYIILYRYLFNGLNALKELNMEENQLMTISGHSFSFLKALKIAKFSNNYLTLEDSYHEYPDLFGSKSPFYDCVSLEELYLANNNISKIFSDWILSDLGLRKLDLKYNNISLIRVSKSIWKKITFKIKINTFEIFDL